MRYVRRLMTRFCEKCKAGYPDVNGVEDTILRCDHEVDGQRCSGEVLPLPAADLAAKSKHKCLVCQDTGQVMVDGKWEKCRRPHAAAWNGVPY